MTNRPSPQIVTIHGFRVFPISTITKAFERALKLLASRGYADPSCVIVKTQRGDKSGVTHAGGRYIHPSLLYGPTVISLMREQGIEPPPMPFLLAPGEKTLFHEWGHHVDLCWSGNEHLVTYSVRWFSHFYEISNLGVLSSADRLDRSGKDYAIQIADGWQYIASELLADLFDEWMQGKTYADSISCDPHHLNVKSYRQDHITRYDFLNGLSATDVRAKTYALFAMGLKGPGKIPELRCDLFGRHTYGALKRLRNARDQANAEMSE